MSELPAGTVTFLFTDIEGSTQLWEQQPDRMRLALAKHDALLRAAIETNGGVIFKTVGDAFCAVFPTARAAVDAALGLQQNLLSAMPSGGSTRLTLKVRVALHTGAAEIRGGDYFGPPLNRVARLLSVAHGGQVLLSEATQSLVRDDLPPGASLKDLGSHRLRDLRRSEHVFQLLHPDLSPDFPPLVSLDAVPNNLPRQLTTFIGRDSEMRAIRDLLAGDAPDTRLLTLLGTAGCGKTRLAVEAAADLLGQHPGGTWFVELAPLADPSLLPQTIAGVLRVAEQPGRRVQDTLADYLGEKRILIVLDNCEHLVQASAKLTEELLQTCPELRILATSREALGVLGERLFDVPPLTRPLLRNNALDAGAIGLPTTVKSLAKYDAARLFVERALALRRDFVLTDQDAEAVARICALLDGIPLALEMAAGWVTTLSLEQIAQRLDRALELLRTRLRTAPDRQQTLRAAVAWSDERLTVPQQELFHRLAVFAGGCTLAAMEAVCSGDDVPPAAILSLLSDLRAKSLVTTEEVEEPRERGGTNARYSLLEFIRQYAREQLEETDALAALQSRHGAFFLAFAERAERELHGAHQAGWLRCLEREHDNLRAALEWSQAQQTDAEIGLRLVSALWRFWYIRGHLTEASIWMERVLSHPGTAADAVRGRALNGAGNIAWARGDYDRADRLHQESLAVRQRLGDQVGSAVSLNNLGIVARHKGDDERARRCWNESLALYRQLGDAPRTAAVLTNLGAMADEHGDLPQARRYYAEALHLYMQLDDEVNTAIVLTNLGLIACRQGQLEEARRYLNDGLELKRQLEDRQGIPRSFSGFARLAEALGQREAAVTLHAATEAAYAAAQMPMSPSSRAIHEQHVRTLQATMDERLFKEAWQRGSEMTQEQAVGFALGLSPDTPGCPANRASTKECGAQDD